MNMTFWKKASATWRHIEENVQTTAIDWSAHTAVTETAIEQGSHLFEYFDDFSLDDVEDI